MKGKSTQKSNPKGKSSSSNKKHQNPSASSSSASSSRKRYASNETRGASEYKKEWSRFMTHVHRKRDSSSATSSSSFSSSGNKNNAGIGGGPTAAAAAASASETTNIKPCMDLSSLASSPFSYLFQSKHNAKSNVVTSAKKIKEQEKRDRERLLLEGRRLLAKEKQMMKTRRRGRNDDDDQQEEGRSLTTTSFDQHEQQPEQEEQKQKRKQENKNISEHEQDQDQEEEEEEEELSEEQLLQLALKHRENLPKPGSKMVKAVESASQKGIQLQEGMNRKERRQALQLTRNAAAEAAAAEAEAQSRKKVVPRDLMDKKLQWYQQGPYPLDVLAEKIVNRTARKHVKTMPDLKLAKYNYQLIHPSWTAAREKKRRESKLWSEGERTTFDFDDEDDDE